MKVVHYKLVFLYSKVIQFRPMQHVIRLTKDFSLLLVFFFIMRTSYYEQPITKNNTMLLHYNKAFCLNVKPARIVYP